MRAAPLDHDSRVARVSDRQTSQADVRASGYGHAAASTVFKNETVDVDMAGVIE